MQQKFPFTLKFSFAKLYQTIKAKNQNKKHIQLKDIQILLESNSELLEGIEDFSKLSAYRQVISTVIEHIAPLALDNNEIKAITTPMGLKTLFLSTRFKQLFGELTSFKRNDIDMSNEDVMYRILAMVIIKIYYNLDVYFNNPFILEKQNNDGTLSYYKTMMNVDYLNIKPLKTPPKIDQKSISKHLENGELPGYWKQMFPPEAWEFNGFVIYNLFDITKEMSLNLLKSSLIKLDKINNDPKFYTTITSIFRSLFKIPDLWISTVHYNNRNKKFKNINDAYPTIGLAEEVICNSDDLLCDYAQEKLFDKFENVLFSDLCEFEGKNEAPFYIKNALIKGIKSYLLVPLWDNEELICILEFGSKQPKALNRSYFALIEELKPTLMSSIKSIIELYESKITNKIQKEYTAIHPSVQWKFTENAEYTLNAQFNEEDMPIYNLEVKFDDLYALYGQIDVSDSTKNRNKAILDDLITQLNWISDIFKQAQKSIEMPLIGQLLHQIVKRKRELKKAFISGKENEIIVFIQDECEVTFRQLADLNKELSISINKYFKKLDSNFKIYYNKRRAFDRTMDRINEYLSKCIDEYQIVAQTVYPHYFERFKTDGVEHNLYIGQSIVPNKNYSPIYLDNLRLWQLMQMCHTMIDYESKRMSLDYPLKVTALVMSFNNKISIRYRQDERKFDVDGAYNANYEIVKKRIDKARIKGKSERITAVNKIVIVYSSKQEEAQYLKFIEYLIDLRLINQKYEMFELENLQNITGLKAIRLSVNLDTNLEDISDIELESILELSS